MEVEILVDGKPALLTSDTATRLGISEARLQQLIAAGEISSVRWRGWRLYALADVDALARKRAQRGRG